MYLSRGASAGAAKKKCGYCDVQVECLAESILTNEQYGIWGGTSSNQRRALRRALRKAGVLGVMGEERHILWNELDAEDDEGASPALEPPARPLQPRDYQVAAVDAVVAGLADHPAVQISMATATGKTLVGSCVAERLGARTVLVLVPNLGLVSQTHRLWARQCAAGDWLFVACDAGDEKVEATTSADEVAMRARRSERTGRRLVVIATYQSSITLVGSGVEFDVAIADEAHHLAGNADKAFAAIVRGEIKARRKLYMTATPRRHVKGRRSIDVRSMDDPVFGPRVFEMTLGQAVERKLVADYRVVVASVEADVFSAVAKEIGEDVDPHLLAGAIAVVRTMGRFGLGSCVSFHTTVDRAQKFSALVGSVARVLEDRPQAPGWSGWVDGATTLRLRDKIVRRLEKEDGWGVLSNARALGEGVDVPSLDAVAIIDPKNSEVDVAQAVGRALRQPAGKNKTGVVILPLMLRKSGEEDPLGGVDRRSLDIVSGALRALRSHDNAVAARFDRLRWAQGHRTSDPGLMLLLRRMATRAMLKSRIEFDVPGGAVGELAGALAFQVVREATSEWEESYGVLLRWAKEHGTAMVPESEKVLVGERTFWLGTWCVQQRTLHRRGLLPEDRVAALSRLQGWCWTSSDDSFRAKVELLSRFVGQHGELPKQATVFQGCRLGGFLNTVRTAYKEGKLSEERVRLLEAVQGWSWDPKADAWERFFSELCAYAERTGHACPSSGAEATASLARWVVKQRAAVREGRIDESRAARLCALPGWVDDERDALWERQFRDLSGVLGLVGRYPAGGDTGLARWAANQKRLYAKGDLPVERAARLETLPGWEWPDVRPRVSFEDWVGLLQEFVEREGHARVPKKAKLHGERLGEWVSRQRVLYGKGELDPKKAATLETLPGWVWHPGDERLAEQMAALRTFAEREGHARVPQRHREGDVSLGSWVNSLRLRRSSLSPELVAELEALPKWSWRPTADLWEEGFAALCAYWQEHGRVDVPVAYVAPGGFRLGQWVSVQRVTWRKGAIDPERAARLETLPGWEWDRQAARWDEHYRALKALAERTGTAVVRRDHVEGDLKLGQWVTVQLRSERNGEMPKDRRLLLEALPGWTWSKHRKVVDGAAGEELRQMRRAAGLTLKEAAMCTGISPTTLADYERGRLRVPAEVVSVIAQLSEVDADAA